jgi:hypothetical protein
LLLWTLGVPSPETSDDLSQPDVLLLLLWRGVLRRRLVVAVWVAYKLLSSPLIGAVAGPRSVLVDRWTVMR